MDWRRIPRVSAITRPGRWSDSPGNVVTGIGLWLRISVVVATYACGDEAPVIAPQPPMTGGLVATVEIVAAEVDPGLFEVVLDGVSSRSVRAGEPAAFTRLAPGVHTLRLRPERVACTAIESAHIVLVDPDRTVEARLQATCLTPGTGMIRARVLAPLGTFGVRVDDGPVRRAPGGSSLDLFGLTPGLRSIFVDTDVPYCDVLGNPRAVVVTPSTVTPVTFFLHCVESGLVVFVRTTGDQFDSDGYVLHVREAENCGEWDYHCFNEHLRVGVQDRVVLEAVHTLPHLVELRDVAPNCAAEPRSYPSVKPSVAVPTVVRFDVECG